jgi:transcriptional regulator with GAF, ATPase, and Fis domain
MAMSKIEVFLSGLPEEEKQVFYAFVSFPDLFFVDWLSVYPPSRLMAVIQSLMKEGWIITKPGDQGCYVWSPDFPRQDITDLMQPDELSRLYRKAIEILLKYNPVDDGIIPTIAGLCLLAGVREEDIDLILKAAVIEEKNHRVSSAIQLYDAILEFTDRFIGTEDQVMSDNTWVSFIKAIERRASLSLFHPSLKKINRFLLAAIGTARRLHDLKSEASLELLIGQNDWMYFQYEQAVLHFNQGWNIIKQIEDEELHKWGLKVQGLTFIIKGQFFRAIEAYEQSLGELESSDNSDFFQLVALNLAFVYTQVGMPQRGLGITETIQNHCQKNENLPLLSYALVTAGIILLEIKQLKNSRSNFERALSLAISERIPMMEVLAGIGLANIECQEGNFSLAAEHYKALWKIRKSSWYHILNFYPLLDTGYILHSKGVSPIDLRPVFDFLYRLKKDDVNPLMYGMIQRLQLDFIENKIPTEEKITILADLEKTVEQMGATFELAKIRIELARLYHQTSDWQTAQSYARKAYDFFSPIARDCFPPDLQHLVPQDKLKKDDRLFDLIIEMGEALTSQENIEKLLTNIITSISRLTGSERAALFIKGEDVSDLKMVASRNLLKEEIDGARFKHTLRNIQAVVNSRDGKIIQYETNGSNSADFRRVIITPLKLGEQIIGVLYQDSRFFSLDVGPDNIKLLSAFASQIAISIDRAQAYDKIAQFNKRLTQENLYYLEEIEELQPFGEIVGVSNVMRILLKLTQKVAPTQSTVLIHGETGVGKELVARAIHRESPRKEGPFIRVNCAALPDSLIDSELFGHEKGSFTGATKTKEGRFELAHQGTIFLDEVSELPLSTQSRLLRILQEKEFQRVGGTKTLRSDFRLITATNKDLSREIATGKFREDLFFRLNVFPIFVPPLRERIEDIPHLAIHFLKLYCSQLKKDYSGISESEMKKLQSYSWPGNIRELSNMIERSVILGESAIRFPDLGDRKVKASTSNQDIKLKDLEREHILEALKKTRGKIGGACGAAELLGLNRTTLIYRMKKLGITNTRHPSILDAAANA